MRWTGDIRMSVEEKRFRYVLFGILREGLVDFFKLTLIVSYNEHGSIKNYFIDIKGILTHQTCV